MNTLLIDIKFFHNLLQYIPVICPEMLNNLSRIINQLILRPFIETTTIHLPHATTHELYTISSRFSFETPYFSLCDSNRAINWLQYSSCSSSTCSFEGVGEQCLTWIGAPITVAIGCRYGRQPKVYWKMPRPYQTGVGHEVSRLKASWKRRRALLE